jgi:hypothetical protein
VTRSKKSKEERTIDADTRMRRLMANAREAEDKGQTRLAARLWTATQKALDEYNRLAGRS